VTSWTGGQKVDPRTRAYKRNAWNPKIPPNRDTSVLCSVERSLRRRVLAELVDRCQREGTSFVDGRDS